MEEEKMPETEKTDAGTDQKFNDLHGEVLGDRVKVLSTGQNRCKTVFPL